MTQTSRPQIPWLADLPADDITGYIRASMTAVCRGHEEMGLLLSYFFAGASWKAKNAGIDIETSPCIDLEHTHEDILKKVHISKKSLNNYLKRLVEWGYLEAPKYQRIYRVCCKEIIEAIKTPPEPIAAKPRGKYAPAKPKPTEEEINAKKCLDLQHKLVNLQQKVVSLQNKVVSLQQELVNLQPFETAESALEQGLGGDFEAPRIYRITKDILEDSLVASASAESDGGVSFLSSLSQFEEKLQEVQNGQTPPRTSYGPHGCSLEEPGKLAGTSIEPARTSAAYDTTPEALQEIPTQVALLPAIPVTPMKPTSPTKTDEKGDSKLSGKKDTRSPEERTRCQKWQAFFNARRGGEPLALKGPRINESECIISLVQKFTDEQITAIDTFVLAEIFPHKLPANKHKVGARIVLDESQNAREVLKDRLKWPGQVIVPVEEPKIIGWTPVQRIYPRNGETVIYG